MVLNIRIKAMNSPEMSSPVGSPREPRKTTKIKLRSNILTIHNKALHRSRAITKITVKGWDKGYFVN